MVRFCGFDEDFTDFDAIGMPSKEVRTLKQGGTFTFRLHKSEDCFFKAFGLWLGSNLIMLQITLYSVFNYKQMHGLWPILEAVSEFSLVLLTIQNSQKN